MDFITYALLKKTVGKSADAHKASHAIGGDDALTPADIGAVTLDELNAESYELIDLNNDVVIMNSHPDDWIIQENRFVSPVVNYVSGNMMASATFMDIGLSKGTYNVFVTTRTEGSGADMFRVQLGGRELPLLSIANTVNDECISVTVDFEQTLSFGVIAGAPYTTISPQMVFYIKKNVKGELTKINSRIDDMEELIPHNILDGGMDYSLRSRSSNQDHTQGYYSTQLGYETVSAGVSQTVIGEYNIIDGNFVSKQPYHCAFMVGNGTSDTDRSNAMSVTWDGTVYAAKDFKVGTVSLVNHNSDTEKHVSSVDKENWNSKQEQLISGTNIKTLNNSSILGSGNIVLLDAYTSAQTGGYTDTLENFYLDLAAMQNLAATLEALL